MTHPNTCENLSWCLYLKMRVNKIITPRVDKDGYDGYFFLINNYLIFEYLF